MNKQKLWIIVGVGVLILFLAIMSSNYYPNHSFRWLGGCFMGPWMGGMWIFPLIVFAVFLIVIFFLFGRGNFRPPWENGRHSGADGAETALDILKKRYANGEITKEQFEQMKKDIL